MSKKPTEKQDIGHGHHTPVQAAPADAVATDPAESLPIGEQEAIFEEMLKEASESRDSLGVNDEVGEGSDGDDADESNDDLDAQLDLPEPTDMQDTDLK